MRLIIILAYNSTRIGIRREKLNFMGFEYYIWKLLNATWTETRYWKFAENTRYWQFESRVYSAVLFAIEKVYFKNKSYSKNYYLVWIYWNKITC